MRNRFNLFSISLVVMTMLFIAILIAATNQRADSDHEMTAKIIMIGISAIVTGSLLAFCTWCDVEPIKRHPGRPRY